MLVFNKNSFTFNISILQNYKKKRESPNFPYRPISLINSQKVQMK